MIGFTIVELLIVIVVIGILAGITMVAFNGVQNRARNVAIRADLNTLSKKLHEYHAGESQFPDWAGLAALNFRTNKSNYAVAPTTNHNLLYCYSTSDRSIFAVIARSTSGAAYYATHETSTVDYPHTWSTNAFTLCSNVNAALTTNYRGYAGEDSSTGPWRAWSGVRN